MVHLGGCDCVSGADYHYGREPASFGLGFVHSEAFSALFQEGMELVEEAAAYLDGPGRSESRLLRSDCALAYANESMQLTSRLMQIASWLLLQRALADGDMTQHEALQEKSRLRISPLTATPQESFKELPQTFRELIGLTARLHARILHLEDLLFEMPDEPQDSDNPVAAQRWLIERAFSSAS